MEKQLKTKAHVK